MESATKWIYFIKSCQQILEKIIFYRFSHVTEILWKRYRHFLGSCKRIGQKSRQFTNWSWKYVLKNMHRKPQNNSSSQDQHLRMRKIRYDRTHGRNMYVCCKLVKKKLRFVPGFSVMIFAYVVRVSFGVRDSQNESHFKVTPSHFTPPKNYFKPP